MQGNYKSLNGRGGGWMEGGDGDGWVTKWAIYLMARVDPGANPRVDSLLLFLKQRQMRKIKSF